MPHIPSRTEGQTVAVSAELWCSHRWPQPASGYRGFSARPHQAFWPPFKTEMRAMTARPALEHRTQKASPLPHLGMALIGFEMNLISHLLASGEANEGILRAPPEMQRSRCCSSLGAGCSGLSTSRGCTVTAQLVSSLCLAKRAVGQRGS